jgi:hypothetical protein
VETDDQITQGEMRRFMERVEAGFRQLGERIDAALLTKVSTERYEAEMGELRRSQAETDGQIKEMLGRQERWRLALFTAIAAPVVVAVLLLVLAAAFAYGQGGSANP